MPTHKPDLSALSITQLSDLTGVSEKTCRSRLMEKGVQPIREDGRTLWYSPRTALPAILATPKPFAEKDRLDGVKADIAELQLGKLRGELVPVVDVEFALAALLSGVRTRILAVPVKTAAEVAVEATPAGCHGIIERAIIEALEAIANVQVEHLAGAAEASGDRAPDRKRGSGS